MKEFIAEIAKHLVDRPDEVEVNFIEGKSTAIIELRVAREDVGKVIGKSGRTANALRTILSAVASRHGQKVVLEIIEEK
ncbi:MAG TPA: KH domain-containing protein [bacterium]|nr:KH domain-containing protein [bacterium]